MPLGMFGWFIVILSKLEAMSHKMLWIIWKLMLWIQPWPKCSEVALLHWLISKCSDFVCNLVSFWTTCNNIQICLFGVIWGILRWEQSFILYDALVQAWVQFVNDFVFIVCLILSVLWYRPDRIELHAGFAGSLLWAFLVSHFSKPSVEIKLVQLFCILMKFCGFVTCLFLSYGLWLRRQLRIIVYVCIALCAIVLGLSSYLRTSVVAWCFGCVACSSTATSTL